MGYSKSITCYGTKDGEEPYSYEIELVYHSGQKVFLVVGISQAELDARPTLVDSLDHNMNELLAKDRVVPLVDKKPPISPRQAEILEEIAAFNHLKAQLVELVDSADTPDDLVRRLVKIVHRFLKAD